MLVLASFTLLSIKTTENFTQLPCDAEPSLFSLPALPDEAYTMHIDGSKYHGYLVQNQKLTGKGTLLFKSGNRYDGELKNGQRDGCGRYSFLAETISHQYYIGQYVNDKPEGRGRLRWKNGNEYRGDFKDGKCEGYGVFEFANGSSKSGVWQKGNLLAEKIISCD
ncbi:hypothetical protein [Komarekiella delphini-convector]